MTAKLSIDLLGRRRQSPWGQAWLCVGAALVAWQGWSWWQAQGLLAAEREGLARLSRPVQRAELPRMSAGDIRRHAQVEQMARQLAVPWQNLLGSIETSAQRQVRLLRLSPDAESGRVDITGWASDPAAMSRFIFQLEADRVLRDVQLIRHDRADNGPGIEFDLQAIWAGQGVAKSADKGAQP